MFFATGLSAKDPDFGRSTSVAGAAAVLAQRRPRLQSLFRIWGKSSILSPKVATGCVECLMFKRHDTTSNLASRLPYPVPSAVYKEQKYWTIYLRVTVPTEPPYSGTEERQWGSPVHGPEIRWQPSPCIKPYLFACLTSVVFKRQKN